MPHQIPSAADLARIAAEKRKLDGLTQADLAGLKKPSRQASEHA